MNVIGRDAREKHKFDVAFTFAKNKLTELRTEGGKEKGTMYR